jgi:guanylate kinase
MHNVHAKIFVLVGPSGVGKSTLISKMQTSEFNINELISYTTRPMRPGEKNGRDYYFVSKNQYKRKESNGEYILSTFVHGNWYGITKKQLNALIKSDRNVFCSLNTGAAKKLKKLFGKNVVTIFIAPPSFDTLKSRFAKRDSGDVNCKLRIKNAIDELKQQDLFDYKIINDDIEKALLSLKNVFFCQSALKLIKTHKVSPLTDNKAIRVISYNIRMSPCVEDESTENAWTYRLPKIKMIINEYMPDIVGVQEVSLLQIKSLKNNNYYALSYKFIGKYPTKKPIESGLGIIYNTKKLSLISKVHTTWLNESQTRANALAWDGSAYERYVIYAKFKHLETGKVFWFMTTHFDHLGIKARENSARIVVTIAENLDAPAVLTGDFNCFPQARGKELYKLLCTYSKIVKDSGKLANSLFGVPGSWIGWDYDFYKQKKGYAKYDFIFVNPVMKVTQHGIIDDKVWDSRFQKDLYPSDHRAVLSDLIM